MSISRSTFAYQIRTCDISICLAPRKIYTSPNCVRIASNECQVERARDADVTRVQLMCCCIACKTVHSRVETSHTLHQTVAFIICKPRSRPTDLTPAVRIASNERQVDCRSFRKLFPSPRRTSMNATADTSSMNIITQTVTAHRKSRASSTSAGCAARRFCIASHRTSVKTQAYVHLM